MLPCQTLEETDLEKDLKVVHVIITLATMPFMVVFNVLLISVICVFRKLHDTQSYLVAVIACFDMLYGLVITPLYALHYSGIMTFTGNKYGCIGMFSLVIVITNGRCIFLHVLTLDRYTAVRYSFWYHRHVAHGNAHIYGVCFIFAYLITVGLLPMLGVHNYREGHCGFYTIWPDWYGGLFFYTVEGLSALIPSILNILLIRIVKQKRKVFLSQLSIMSDSVLRMERERMTSVRISMYIYLSYLIFYLPYTVSTVARRIERQIHHCDLYEQDYIIYFDYITWIWYFGFMGVINPLLMFCLKGVYRNALRTIIRFPCWRWHELQHDKLGQSYSTSHSTALSKGRSRCSLDNVNIADQSRMLSGVTTPELEMINKEWDDRRIDNKRLSHVTWEYQTPHLSATVIKLELGHFIAESALALEKTIISNTPSWSRSQQGNSQSNTSEKSTPMSPRESPEGPSTVPTSSSTDPTTTTTTTLTTTTDPSNFQVQTDQSTTL